MDPTASLQIVHHDEDLVVIDKPAGLLAVPGRGDAGRDCAWVRVRERWPDALVVHRLDMATSGLLLFARGSAVQRQMSIAWAARRVDKVYLAWVRGLPAEASGTIALPLAADWPARPRQRVDHDRGKPSVTHWQRLSADAGRQCARLRLEPATGRSHQLRVHLAAIGHPILGDALYGDATSAPRLLLHAAELAFDHPRHGTRLHLVSDPAF